MAVVNRLGQVTAKTVGTAIIQGTIQAVSEDTGRVIVFSQVSFHFVSYFLIFSMIYFSCIDLC